MYIIRRVTSAVGGQSVCCEEKVGIIRNVRAVQCEERVISTRRLHSQ